MSVGERDGAKRGDLVGAITGEADITGAQIGKIDLRDTYALVDIASPVADRVVERLTGISIRGRRVTARQDRGGLVPDRRRRMNGVHLHDGISLTHGKGMGARAVRAVVGRAPRESMKSGRRAPSACVTPSVHRPR